jgi:hypothetical protein
MFSLDAPGLRSRRAPPLQVTRKPGRPNLLQTRHSERQIIISGSWPDRCILIYCLLPCCYEEYSPDRRVDSVYSQRPARGRPEHATQRGSTHERGIREVTQASVIAINWTIGAALRRPPAARRHDEVFPIGDAPEYKRRKAGPRRGRCGPARLGSEPAPKVAFIRSIPHPYFHTVPDGKSCGQLIDPLDGHSR